MCSGKHKTVQAQHLEYAEDIGRRLVLREEAENRRGGIPAPYGSNNRGLEPPRSGGSFLDPYGEIDVHQNRLPHWQQGDVFVFVTWRLADSLPKEKLNRWKEERAVWLKYHPEPWDEKTKKQYHERFSRQIDEWLDQGGGSCVLKNSALSGVVANALHHFDGERYGVASFVVMPNHVHVLFRPFGKHTLGGIVKSWKGFTGREINKRLGISGSLWQEDYWDRLIRNERHFFRVAEYIRENPVRAKLSKGQFVLFEKERGFSNPSSL